MEPFITEDDDGQEWVGVRIPIGVNSRGEWIAYGQWKYNKDEGFAALTRECEDLGLGAHDVHYIYARVPVHEHRVFAGKSGVK